MEKRIYVGVLTAIVILGLVMPTTGFFGLARAETETAKGKIGNENPQIDSVFTVADANGLTKTAPDDGTYDPGVDPVIYPQFNDVLTIYGSLKDFNGLEGPLSAVTYDEILGATFEIRIYQDANGDNIIDTTNDVLYDTWTAVASGSDVGGSTGSLASTFELIPVTGKTEYAVALDDGDVAGGGGTDALPGTGAADANIEWASGSDMSYNVVPVYSEVWIVMEDSDGSDLSDNGTVQGTGYTGTPDDDPLTEGTTVKLGFYCQQAYKILGIYDEDAHTWVYSYDYSSSNPYAVWTFRSVIPDGDADDHNQPTTSGAMGFGTVNGTNDYCLAIQWLLPNTKSNSLQLSFAQDFITQDDGGSTLDTIPNNDGLGTGYTDFFYGLDTGPTQEIVTGIDGTYNSSYTPIWIFSEEWTTLSNCTLDDPDTTISWQGGGIYLSQYNVLFVKYRIDVPSITADGVYTCSYTVTAV